MTDPLVTLVDEHSSDEPEVNAEHMQKILEENKAVQNTEPPSAPFQQSTQRPSSGPVDAKGTRFDPRIHNANPDGSPKVYSNGNYRRKRGVGTGSGYPSFA